jgi:hypothetical protein
MTFSYSLLELTPSHVFHKASYTISDKFFSYVIRLCAQITYFQIKVTLLGVDKASLILSLRIMYSLLSCSIILNGSDHLEVMCAEKTGGFNLVNYRHSSGVYHEQETEDLHRRI